MPRLSLKPWMSDGTSVTGPGSRRGMMFVLMGLLVATASWGHRDHGVWTEGIWSEDRFELAHHVHLQDAQSVLRGLAPSVLLDSPEGLARVALYVEQRFAVVAGDEPVALELIGAEVEDDFLYVYQEWPVQEPAGLPGFRSQLLTDVLPDARTWVRFQAPGINETLVVGSPGALNPGTP